MMCVLCVCMYLYMYVCTSVCIYAHEHNYYFCVKQCFVGVSETCLQIDFLNVPFKLVS